MVKNSIMLFRNDVVDDENENEGMDQYVFVDVNVDDAGVVVVVDSDDQKDDKKKEDEEEEEEIVVVEHVLRGQLLGLNKSNIHYNDVASKSTIQNISTITKVDNINDRNDAWKETKMNDNKNDDDDTNEKYSDDDDDVDIFEKSTFKFVMMIVFVFVLLIDIEDIYFLCGSKNHSSSSYRSSSNNIVSTSSTAINKKVKDVATTVLLRSKYLPVAAPTKGTGSNTNDYNQYNSITDIHFTPIVVPSTSTSTYTYTNVNNNDYRRTGSGSSALIASESVIHAGMMIPSPSRSSSTSIITTYHNHNDDDDDDKNDDGMDNHLFRPVLTVDDVDDDVTDSTAPFVPMRSLIPYTTPRPTQQIIPVPSIRTNEYWIPTYNFTLNFMDVFSPSVDYALLDYNDHIKLYKPDRRPMESKQQDIENKNNSKEYNNGSSIALTQYTFNEYIQNHENVLITFYYPCTRYEMKYVPLWTNLTNAIYKEQYNIVTATVDCHSNPNICHEQGCYKFPTIRWFHNGNVYVDDYNHGRNARKLLIFVKTKLLELNQKEMTELQQPNPTTLNHSILPVQAPKTVYAQRSIEDDNDVFVEGMNDNYSDDERDQQQQQRLMSSIAFMKKQRNNIPVVVPSIMKTPSTSIMNIGIVGRDEF